METDKNRGEWFDPAPAKMPFREWAERYLTGKLSIRARTRVKYESSLRAQLLPAIGHMPMHQITRDDVQRWVTTMVGDGWQPETVRGHYRLFVSIMSRAVNDGVIPKTPCYSIELPRATLNEPRFLEGEQVERLAECHPERYRAMIYTAAYLGLRWQELAGLRRTSVDMRPGQLAPSGSKRPSNAPTVTDRSRC